MGGLYPTNIFHRDGSSTSTVLRDFRPHCMKNVFEAQRFKGDRHFCYSATKSLAVELTWLGASEPTQKAPVPEVH